MFQVIKFTYCYHIILDQIPLKPRPILWPIQKSIELLYHKKTIKKWSHLCFFAIIIIICTLRLPALIVKFISILRTESTQKLNAVTFDHLCFVGHLSAFHVTLATTNNKPSQLTPNNKKSKTNYRLQTRFCNFLTFWNKIHAI